MAAVTLLYDSFLCRLCAEENKNSTSLFSAEENQQNLCDLVNTYLPLKVEDDGQYPRRICPGCSIQLEATKQFFDLLIAGQSKLRELLQIERDALSQAEQQRHLEDGLKEESSASSVETYTIQSQETGENILIQIFSGGPLFGLEHDLALRSEGLDKPKRKRGRPSKQEKQKTKNVQEEQPVENDQTVEPEEQASEEPEVEGDGRRRRRRKLPSRFREVLQGKELDKIFQEQGIDDDDNGQISIENNAESGNKTLVEEVIGRMETEDGQNLGDLVVLNKTKSRQKRRYQCFYCQLSFLHRARLQTHMKLHQLKTNSEEKNVSNIQQSNCLETNSTCEVNLVESQEMPPENASKEDSLLATNQCDKCNKYFSSKQNYEVHVRAVHEGIKPFSCHICHKTFSYASSLKLHMVTHKRGRVEPRQYQCEVCTKSFPHPSSLLYHRNSQHGDGRRYVCSKCNKSFRHRQLLQRHQLVHSDERPHSCVHCNAAFKTQSNLFNHMVVHGGPGVRRYRCSYSGCDRLFAHRSSLILHERIHLGIKPYVCEVCSKAFCQKGNLIEHRRIHTGEKPYQCDECGRAFTTSSQFHLHRKRHTGERPLGCAYCHKTFLHRGTWKCHIRRHMDVRPYTCKICSRAFAEAWALRKHERLHTGEKPYQCEECSKAFTDSSNLAKHRRTHRKNELEQVKVVQQLVDESGQPISLSTPEGQQIQFVSNGQQVHGLMPDGTLLPFDLTLQETETSCAEEKSNAGKAGNDDVTHLLQDGMQNIQLLSQATVASDETEGMCLLTAYSVESEDDGLGPRLLPITLQDTTAVAI